MTPATATRDENNLVTRREKVGLDCTDTSGAATVYEWDVLNRLVRIDNPDGTFAAYHYDAQGRRIEKDVNGSITRYVYDGPDILLEYDSVDQLQARYTHGDEVDQPLAMARAGLSYFYHTDHLGSVRLVTDGAGAVANSYDYDAFGSLEATSFETVANPFAFTARERDAESGLMFYRARYYDPKLGRFISEDPIGFEGEDLNLYRYVFNVPLMFSDASGEYITYGMMVAYARNRVAIVLVLAKIVKYIIKAEFRNVKAEVVIAFLEGVNGVKYQARPRTPIGTRLAASLVNAIGRYLWGLASGKKWPGSGPG